MDILSDTFVLKVAGKDLSTNDFTDADKTKLDNLPAISLFMKALLETNDATEARALLKVGRQDIWDEVDNRWNCTNAFLDTGTKKFGTTFLHTGVNNGYLINPDGITLGGSNGFTIAFWAYASSANTAAQGFWSFGSKESMIQIFRDANNKIATNCIVNSSAVFSPASADRTAYPTGQWNHVELDYNASNGTIYLFLNGTLIYSIACSFFSTAQTYPMYIGLGGLNSTLNYFTGWIDEFVVLKTCLHTSSFTAPTSAYTAGENTLALLHFD